MSFGPGVFFYSGGNLMPQKDFKTYDEQINILISRGVDISTPESKSFAKKALQHEGYYNLINGYNKLFLSDTDTYKSDTTIEEIFALYTFDKKLREIFLQNILHLETNIKSLIAYYFPQSHPECNYLVYGNFDTAKRDSYKNIPDLLAAIQRQIASRSSDPSITHYLKNYGYVPLWVLNNILTFGTISKFYSLMLQPERQSISKIFHIHDNELESILFYISSVRNFCAHGNRLYCYRSKRPLGDMELHNILQIPKSSNNEYLYGKRDLFAVMIALKATLSKQEFRRMVKDIDIAIKNTCKNFKVLSEKELLDSMGFPIDWKAKLLTNLSNSTDVTT